jgi:hypothetical protein
VSSRTQELDEDQRHPSDDEPGATGSVEFGLEKSGCECNPNRSHIHLDLIDQGVIPVRAGLQPWVEPDDVLRVLHGGAAGVIIAFNLR